MCRAGMMIVQMQRQRMPQRLICSHGLFEKAFLDIPRKPWPKAQGCLSDHVLKTQILAHE